MKHKNQRLSEFVQKEKLLLEDFYLYWIKENKKDAVNFPMAMAPGEWTEQFNAFIGTTLNEN